MARHALSGLQLRLMKVLWERDEVGVADVQADLSGLAYTTVATLLRRMEARGLVTHRVDGRRFLYRAAVPPDAVTRGMLDDVLERLFEGSLSDMLSHLLATREVSKDELRRLERLIAERKKQS
jgi:predicted transcriptional regulator